MAIPDSIKNDIKRQIKGALAKAAAKAVSEKLTSRRKSSKSFNYYFKKRIWAINIPGVRIVSISDNPKGVTIKIEMSHGSDTEPFDFSANT